jgi:Cell division protein CrgA
MAKPAKRRVQGGPGGGRTTPRGGPTRAPKQTNVSEPTGRYTPPIPRDVKISPVWVPILMFAFLGIGTLLILINYTGVVWNTSNWILLAGLGLILAGIITATQYH